MGGHHISFKDAFEQDDILKGILQLINTKNSYPVGINLGTPTLILSRIELMFPPPMGFFIPFFASSLSLLSFSLTCPK